MEKIVNINIGGSPFIINEDAYKFLNNYLNTIDSVLRENPDSSIIEQDIEQRIAEILYERFPDPSHILTVTEIESVVERIGEPQTFVDEDELLNSPIEENSFQVPPTDTNNNHSVPPPPFNPGFPLKKRLYRDPDEKIIGGVCSGIAHYFGIDPVWVRVIAVVLGFCSFSTLFIVYVILWVIIPPATTPYEQMQMYGKPTSISDIGESVSSFYRNSVKQNFRDISHQTGSSHSVLDTIMNILGVAGKILLIFCAIIAIPIGIALCFLLIINVIGLIMLPFNSTFLMAVIREFWDPAIPGSLWFFELLSLSIIICFGIPVFAVIKCAFSINSNRAVFSRSAGKTLLITWLIGVALFLGIWIYARSNPQFNISSTPHDSEIKFEEYEELDLDELENELENNLDFGKSQIMVNFVN